MAILLIDNLLHLPNFKANERLWQTLKTIKVLISQSQVDKIYWQTFNVDNQVFKYFVANQEKEFFEQELKYRQELGYPPFSRITKLIYQSPSRQPAELATQKLYKKLTSEVERARLKAQISEPQLVYQSRIRGRWRYAIIIKSASPILPLIKLIPEDWIIDVDPENL